MHNQARLSAFPANKRPGQSPVTLVQTRTPCRSIDKLTIGGQDVRKQNGQVAETPVKKPPKNRGKMGGEMVSYFEHLPEPRYSIAEFLFLAYPGGPLHPAQDVTHQQHPITAMQIHRAYRTTLRGCLLYGLLTLASEMDTKVKPSSKGRSRLYGCSYRFHLSGR